MPASISTLFMSRFRSSIDRIEGRERDAARAHISAVKVWMVTLARAASAATQPISVDASRSFIAQPDDSSTACFGPGNFARPRIVDRSERSTGCDVRLRVQDHRLDLHLDFGRTERLVGPAFASDDVAADEQVLARPSGSPPRC